MHISNLLTKDEYLINPMMTRFLSEHKLKPAGFTKADYVKAIEDYANDNAQNELEVKNWVKKCSKEGSKEFIFKKIHNYGVDITNESLLLGILQREFNYSGSKDMTINNSSESGRLIDYELTYDENGDSEKLTLLFLKKCLEGNVGSFGEPSMLPVWVEIYLKEDFIVARSKAKSTIHFYDATNAYIDGSSRMHTPQEKISLLNRVADVFGLEVEEEAECRANAESAFFGIYKEYSFTPEVIINKVNQERKLINDFIDGFFSDLGLDPLNKENAVKDAKILIEKFISINGDNIEQFKRDRDAYLIKVASKDEIELTSIDTVSSDEKPLQCTEVFFDSKKSVINAEMCKKLALVFKRIGKIYKESTMLVQFLVLYEHGCFKTVRYTEEVDIQNVLRTIFKNYQ